MEESRAGFVFSEKQTDHRRGRFPAVAVGISHGNGTQVSVTKCPIPAS